MQLPLANNINLHPISHRFQVIADYWSKFRFFTALHGMQTRSSDVNSVRPSVRLSVTHVYCDKTVERSVQIYIPYERSFSLVL